MPFTYSTSFREAACVRLVAGERPEELHGELKVATATLYRWKKQALIDAGLRSGTKSFEPDTLARAQQRIKDLEDELELVKAASDLFNGNEVVRPKGSARSSAD